MNCPKCNAEIAITEVEYYNSENEEGEDYGVVEYWCDECNYEMSCNQWWHIENQHEAVELLKEYLKEK
jgi:hypothetical protein